MISINPKTILKNLNFKEKKKKAPLLGALVFVAIIGFIGWLVIAGNLGTNKELYAKVAGHEIYEEDVRKLIDNSSQDVNISDHDATVVLADKYLFEELAREQNVAVSDEEVKQETGLEPIKDHDSLTYGYQYQVNGLLVAKLSANSQGVYKGKLLVAHFNRYVPYKSPLLEEEKANNPKIGDTDLITEDKQYAQDFITSLYEQVNSGEISFDEAIALQHKDPRVGKEVYSTLSHSGPFDNSIDQEGLIMKESVRSKLRNLTIGQISEPFVVEVSDSVNNDSNAESYYLAVRIDEAEGGDFQGSLDEYIVDAKERLGYEIYI